MRCLVTTAFVWAIFLVFVPSYPKFFGGTFRESRMRKPMKTLKKDANDAKARGMDREKVPARTKNNVKALAHLKGRRKAK